MCTFSLSLRCLVSPVHLCHVLITCRLFTLHAFNSFYFQVLVSVLPDASNYWNWRKFFRPFGSHNFHCSAGRYRCNSVESFLLSHSKLPLLQHFPENLCVSISSLCSLLCAASFVFSHQYIEQSNLPETNRHLRRLKSCSM
jgi:hypothetical protein